MAQRRWKINTTVPHSCKKERFLRVLPREASSAGSHKPPSPTPWTSPGTESHAKCIILKKNNIPLCKIAFHSEKDRIAWFGCIPRETGTDASAEGLALSLTVPGFKLVVKITFKMRSP